MVPTKQQIDQAMLGNDVVDCKFDGAIQISRYVNLYGARFGDEVFIGPFVEVQKDVIIGDRTRIQSHSFLCSGVSIGKDCFIGHGVVFINDPMHECIDRTGKSWLETIIMNNVRIGSNSTILPVYIHDNITVGAGSVVTKNLEVPGIYAGNPARLIRSYEDTV